MPKLPLQLVQRRETSRIAASLQVGPTTNFKARYFQVARLNDGLPATESSSLLEASRLQMAIILLANSSSSWADGPVLPRSGKLQGTEKTGPNGMTTMPGLSLQSAKQQRVRRPGRPLHSVGGPSGPNWLWGDGPHAGQSGCCLWELAGADHHYTLRLLTTATGPNFTLHNSTQLFTSAHLRSAVYISESTDQLQTHQPFHSLKQRA